MIPVVNLSEIIASQPAHTGYELLGPNEGCVNGCRCGVSIYKRTEYDVPKAHDDQEGFFVLEGRGYALVGDQEIVMEPGTAFMVPAGVPHTTKRDSAYEYCKVLWFHGAV